VFNKAASNTSAPINSRVSTAALVLGGKETGEESTRPRTFVSWTQ
jgi:hypothetical protein